MQVLGVYEKELVEPLIKVLNNLGVESAVSVYGMDGMDEISASDKTFVCELKDGKTMSYEISPEYFGMDIASKEDLIGGDAKENAEITLSILNGEKGPKRNAVLLNSAAGLYVAGVVDSLRDGVALAEDIIDSGRALKQLEKFIEFTNG
jgi:anthranilate phosphoribosyltransferase